MSPADAAVGGRAGHERARLLGEATGQLVGGGRIAVLAGGEAIDVAFELRILRAQRQRDAQPPERLVGPAEPMEELAERDQRGRIVGEARRQRGEAGERPFALPRPFVESGQLDRQRRQIGAQRRGGGEPRAGLCALAAGARPRRELVQQIDLQAALARQRRQRAIAGAPPAGRLIETGRRPSHARQRLHGGRQ